MRSVSLSLCGVALALGCTGPAPVEAVPRPAPPAGRVWVGATPENRWDEPLLARMRSLDAATGVRHAVWAEFAPFPGVVDDDRLRRAAADFLMACRARGAVALLTVESLGGLETYDRGDIEALARLLAAFPLPILLRWDHEFNGGWYLWARQPGRYVERFREVAAVMHATAPNVALVWAPNAQDVGYPWPGDTVVPLPAPGSADFTRLDTDADGVIDARDDAYAPYWPGDDAVDWVGVSAYAPGQGPGGTLNWNVVPPPGRFLATVRALHDRYAAAKPIIVAETAAVYDPDDARGGGATELAIKSAWIEQVYGPGGAGSGALPGIAAVVWFNQRKEISVEQRAVAGVRVRDERVDADPAVAAAYRRAVEAGPFEQGPVLVGSAAWGAR